MTTKEQIEYKFGANILENLTTGMYQDSKIIYREYIQNSCDQIDKAVVSGLLKEGEGEINIWFEHGERTITIQDNATGIPAKEFRKKLGDIADSDKIAGEDKGFRGIGRLCGLAYCKELVFTSKAKGEEVISIMRCDAVKMRLMIDENIRNKKHTAVAVLNEINSFETQKTKNLEEHYFKVDLIQINEENTDLLDEKTIRDYLSFVAPVPYQAHFNYRNKIKRHADKLQFKIDEYTIKLDGEQIFKRYSKSLKRADGKDHDDEVHDVIFKEFNDKKGNLIAWSWIGLTNLKGVIPKSNQMRGLRLRKENIQIGDDDVFQKLFKEDRGNHYFIGEVFAVSKDLIPNSQRDYFNENPMRAHFEKELKRFFEELHKVYHVGSAINSATKKIEAAEKLKSDFKEMVEENRFISREHRDEELKRIEEAEKEAEKAERIITSKMEKATPLVSKVIDRIVNSAVAPDTQIPVSSDLLKPIPKITRRADKLSSYNKRERDLISKIFDIIRTSTDEATAEIIMCNIEEGLS